MGLVVLICCFTWVVKNISFFTFLIATLVVICFVVVDFVFEHICTVMSSSCETPNQEIDKKTTSAQFYIEPTKQYPVLYNIQNIISNLSQLETDNNLDKNMFVKFHVIKDQYDADYQKTIEILNKLKTIEQFDETHLTIFNHYLDLFNNEQNRIYEKIKQQYNDELNIMDDKLHHFNEIVDKTL